jgi:hypothetical protein
MNTIDQNRRRLYHEAKVINAGSDMKNQIRIRVALFIIIFAAAHLYAYLHPGT